MAMLSGNCFCCCRYNEKFHFVTWKMCFKGLNFKSNSLFSQLKVSKKILTFPMIKTTTLTENDDNCGNHTVRASLIR